MGNFQLNTTVSCYRTTIELANAADERLLRAPEFSLER